MKKNKKGVKIDLGYGCLFEDGEIKSVLSEEGESDIWLTWDEGWQWVLSSLKKLAEKYNHEPTED